MTFVLFQVKVFESASAIYPTFVQAIVAFGFDVAVTLVVTAVTTRPDPETLGDIVYSRRRGRPEKTHEPWWRRPALLGGGVLVAALVLNVIFA